MRRSPSSSTFRADAPPAAPNPNHVIPYFTADPATVLARRVTDAISAAVTRGELTNVNARNLGSGVVHISGNPALEVDLAGTPNMATSPRLPVAVRVPPAGAGQIAEGQEFTIGDGVNPVRNFVFDDTINGVLPNPGNDARVSFNSATYNVTSIGRAIKAAIDAEVAAGRLTGLTADAVAGLVTIRNASNSAEDDEDGVTFNAVLTASSGPGYAPSLTLAASGSGFVDAWIDWNRNGQFDPAEKILNRQAVVTGANTFPVTVPAAASVGLTKARFRISPNGGLFPIGLSVGGEVEDHDVRVLSNAAPSVVNSIASLINSGDFLNGKLTRDEVGDDGVLDATDHDNDGVLDLDEDGIHQPSGVDLSVDLMNMNGKAVFGDVDIANGNADFLKFALVSNDNAALVVPTLTGSRLDLNFLQDKNGIARIVIEAKDHAGLVIRDTLTIDVRAVNDAPQFTPGGDRTVLEDAGSVSIPAWATNIVRGPLAATDEASQTLTFDVAVTGTTGSLAFVTPPAVSTTTGNLTFDAAADSNGTATVTVQLRDNGGVLYGGRDRMTATFTLTVTAVNDEPSFTKGPDQTVLEDAAAQTVGGWATEHLRGGLGRIRTSARFPSHQ